jgi:spermidine/putrescine transport system permease protein
MMTGSTIEAREKRQAIFYVLPGLVFTVAFFVIPFLFMAVTSFAAREGRRVVMAWTLANYEAFIAKSQFIKALMVSLEITVTVTVISILLAYPLAAIIAFRVPKTWQRTVLILSVLPFWTSYVVRSYSWLLVLAKNGVINQALMAAGIIDEPLALSSTRFATVTGFVHFFVMLLTLTIYANLVQLSPNYRRAAADLGANAWQTFIHVILPLTLPGIMTGAFLTFVLCIGDYITPQILGGNNELVLPQIIMLQLGRRADIPMASALSIVLMAVVTLAYLFSAKWLKMERT